MMTVLEICEALGRKNMERRLGVSKAAISNAVSGNAFPPGWYGVISAMCAEKSLACSLQLFNFRKAACSRPSRNGGRRASAEASQ